MDVVANMYASCPGSEDANFWLDVDPTDVLIRC